MTYSVNITATNQVVNVTNTSTNVVVSDSGTIIFTVTTTSTNVVVNSTSTNVNAYYDAIELRLNNLNTYWKGVWTTSTYNMGDLVNYRDSVFLLKDFSSDVTAVYTSTVVPPSDTTYWTRIVWHEAPFDHVTVTNALIVGGSTTLGGTLGVTGNTTIGGTAGITGNTTIGGTLTVANTATLNLDTVISRDLSVGRNATVAGSLTVGPATANGGLAIKGPLYVDGISEFTGTATFDSTVLMPYSDLTARNITSNQRVTANNLVVSTTATLNGLTTVNGLSNFNAQASFNSGITANLITATNASISTLQVSTQTVDNLRVNPGGRFRLGYLDYPVNEPAFYGQVLAVNGVNTATWVNLGDLVYWSLSDDLRTNGNKIVSGNTNTNLTIAVGTTSSNLSQQINLKKDKLEILAPYTATIFLASGGTYPSAKNYDYIKLADENYNWTGVTIGSQNGIRIEGNTGVRLYSSNGDINIEPAPYDAGYINFLGKVKGTTPNYYVKLFSGIQFPDGSVQTTSSTGSTGTYTLPIASASTLGGIKVGTNLSIDGSGVLSASTASSYTLPTAGTGGGGTLGGVRVDGTTITINGSGVISASTTATQSSFSLSNDSYTNGKKIYYRQTPDGSGISTQSGYFLLNESGIELQGSYISGQPAYINIDTEVQILTPRTGVLPYRTNNIILSSGGETNITAYGNVNIQSTGTSEIDLLANKVVVGNDASNSKLQVGKIYNFAGTYAPNFPAGIQFGDQTVQITAYDDGRFNFGNITPPFNAQSWQDLITQLLGDQGTITTPNTGHWTFGPILI